ncbi:hypothetical protein ZWY2020_026737 [Hordeum vulgare]|nr:hypothetical protein ZWY2020_026737 [Hordeum vulgare]
MEEEHANRLVITYKALKHYIQGTLMVRSPGSKWIEKVAFGPAGKKTFYQGHVQGSPPCVDDARVYPFEAAWRIGEGSRHELEAPAATVG